jgi:UDP-N-acetylmuramoyl-tripeptide--D-alanyl-D-alanine ligase
MSLETACNIINGQLMNPRTAKKRFRGVSVDTRTLSPANAFFCLRGEHADGHRYAETAGQQGAGAIVAEHLWAKRHQTWPVPVIGVDDPLTALGDLAAEFRRHFPTRYVAITGSVGKTTTKEMIAAALATRFSVFKSPGNYNNLIGIPLALLGRKDTPGRAAQRGVLELGMSTPGEIARLTQIVKPDWGVVTRIAPSHLLQMKSLAAIARAKRELFAHAGEQTIAFLNQDDPYQRQWQKRWDRTTVSYGLDHDADIKGDDVHVRPDGTAAFRVNGRHRFSLPLFGAHNVANALAAIAVARRLGVPFRAIAEALNNLKPLGDRSRIARLGAMTLLEDCYNANPTSTIAALNALAAFSGTGRKIAVLGAMRELGPKETEWHRKVGRVAMRAADIVVAVGELGKAYVPAAKTHRGRTETYTCSNTADAVRLLKRLVSPGDVVLLKASHSEHFEEIAAQLREQWKPGARRRRG